MYLIQKTRLLAVLIVFLSSVITPVINASQLILEKANIALTEQNYVLAADLFKQVQNHGAFSIEAHFGLAKTELFTDKLDSAESYIEKVLKVSRENPDHFFIAARIAGRQAQQANYFSKIGYAKDVKQYFTSALDIDAKHTPSVIGLIRFHQQAPTIAGGDNAAVPEFVQYLWELDAREAFFFEAPKLLSNEGIDRAFNLYGKALDAESKIEQGRFRYDFAMLLSSHGFYKEALEQILKIDMKAYTEHPAFYHMRFYQIAKTAAESNSQLELGLKSIGQYQTFSEKDKSIPSDWISFRNAQLSFLINNSEQNKKQLEVLAKQTQDKDLREKIKGLLRDV